MQRFAQHCCFTSGIVMLLVLPFARSSCCATVLCQQLVAQQFVQLITTKYFTVGRQIARATVETSSIAMWHKKPLHEFAARVIRCVQTAYCLVDFLPLGVSRIVIF